MTGGVLARFWGAGEAGAFKFSTFKASPSGFLITIAALFRVGLMKAEVSGAALDCGVREWETAGVIDGVPGWPMLEAGRWSDTCEEFRDIGWA
jgi:hypothetical protein